MASTSAAAAADEKTANARPEKPDEEQFQQDVAQAMKEHKAALEKLNETKAKIELATPKNRDSPKAKRQQELRAQLAEIRSKQSTFKTSRGGTLDRIASLDSQLKSRINEQRAARSRVPFKNVEEVDREIKRLEVQVDGGKMKLVDEKKALAEVSSLRKQRKGFSGFEEQEKTISDLKTQIAELRKTLDNPESKALSEKYNTITKELDELNKEKDEAFKSLNQLRDERSKLQAGQSEKWAALQAIRDSHSKAKRAYKDYDDMVRKQRQERLKAERDAQAKEKRKKTAEARLEEASAPAYLDEILTAEGLIRYFDPNTPVESKSLRGPSGFAAVAQRTVDDNAAPKGSVLSKKDDRDEVYFMGTGGKKGKKGKKGAASGTTTPSENKFNLSIGVLEELSKVNVDAPSSQADVPAVLEKLKEKLAEWKADQDRKTKESIAKAQAQIDALEAEAQEEASAPQSQRARDSAKNPSQANAGANITVSAEAELKQEKDAAADVAEEIKKTIIEDAE